MRKQHLLILGAVVVLVVALSIGATTAWFTDEDHALNKITMGNVEITVHEDGWKDNPTVAPGSPISKKPTVENVGKNPCYVRVKVVESKSGPTVTYAGMGANWEKKTDGYYYYKQPLTVSAPGNVTTPLFTQVTFDFIEGNVNPDFEINVYAEAVQSEGFKDCTAAFAAVAAK